MPKKCINVWAENRVKLCIVAGIKRVEEMLSQDKQETGISAEISCKTIPGTQGWVSQTAAQKDSSKSGRSSQPVSTQNPTSTFFFFLHLQFATHTNHLLSKGKRDFFRSDIEKQENTIMKKTGEKDLQKPSKI